LNNEVYQYSTSTGDWTRLTPSGTRPSARREAAVTYSQTQNRLWVYGGVNNLGALLSDLWYLDLSSGLPGTWVNVTYANAAPDGRRSATIGHDTEGNRLLVFGGFSQVSQGNAQVHAFHLPSSSWFSLNVGNTGAEENCFRSAGVWDNQFRRMIHTPPLSKKAQAVVITTNGPTWQYMLPAPSQNHATAATGLYDPATGRYYALFGNKTVGGRGVGTNSFRTFRLK
jgi:hypothetical protein